MKAWITKDALRTGEIREVEGQLHVDRQNTLVVKTPRGKSGVAYEAFYYGEWHETHAAAIEKAEAIRNNRVNSLKAQIAKLEAMKFLEAP